MSAVCTFGSCTRIAVTRHRRNWPDSLGVSDTASPLCASCAPMDLGCAAAATECATKAGGCDCNLSNGRRYPCEQCEVIVEPLLPFVEPVVGDEASIHVEIMCAGFAALGVSP